jgi:bifunctional aromatase (cyclase/dehydratase)
MIASISAKAVGLAAFATFLLASAALSAAELTAADYTAIQQLYARYNSTIDHGDAEGWASTFTPDGVFANTFKGHDALVGFVNTWRSSPAMNGAMRRHFSADLIITPSADGATGAVSTILVDLSTHPASMANYVTYSDVLVKTAEGWRFKVRSVKPEAAPAPAASATPGAPAKPSGQ